MTLTGSARAHEKADRFPERRGASGGVEREVKFDAEPGFVLPDLAEVPGVASMVALPDADLHAVYFDTPDLRLIRNGITLRHRQDTTVSTDAEQGWTLKLPATTEGVDLARRELTWPGPYGPVPDEAARLVRAWARTAPLVPVARLNTHRRRFALRDSAGTTWAEVDDDVVSVMDGSREVDHFREIEVELTPAAPDGFLEAVVARLVAAGAVRSDPRPKVIRALGSRAAEPPDVTVPDLTRRATIGDVAAAAIAAGFTRLVNHDPGIRLDDDPEHVHQARVATRRLRSDLRTLKTILDPAWVDPVRAELRWLGRALGEVRDADVLSERLRADSAQLAKVDTEPAAMLLERLTAERNAAQTRLLEELDSERYVQLLDTLAAAAVAPPLPDTDDDAIASQRASRVLPRLVRKTWRRLARAVAELPENPPDDALHQIRIRAKHVRYAAEAAAPVIGAPARRFARSVARIQDELGELHDAVVAEQWLRRSAGHSATQALVAGQLITLERQQQAARRQAWPATWEAARRKRLRKWLET